MNQRLFMRLYFGLFSLIAGMLVVLLYYFAQRTVEAENNTKSIAAEMTSKAVLDKIDRNLSERYSDVQAFAYNRLAVEALTRQTSVAELKAFMNRMVLYYELYDLMMLCDKQGNIIATNTASAAGNPIEAQPLIGNSVINTDWFRACIRDNKQDVWHSDFTTNLHVSQLCHSSGQGVAFACPVRNTAGETIGVWYTFTNWQATAEKIRQEAENELRQFDKNAQVLLLTGKGSRIQATTESISANSTPELFFEADVKAFKQQSRSLPTKRILSHAKSKGKYAFTGNEWQAITLVTKTTLTWAAFFSGEMRWIVLVILCINALMIMVAYSVISRNSRQLNYITTLREIIEKIARGLFVSIPDDLKTKDEMGQISQAISKLTQALQNKTQFSDEIARGNLGARLAELEPEDKLGNSLINMCDQLQKVEATHQINAWKAQGLAGIAAMLRENTDLESLTNNVLTYLVKYLNANQGSLFIALHENQQSVLKMIACYAYSRRRFLDEPFTLLPGQGLVGQCYQAGDFIYLTEIPETYVRITSGLGESTPRTLLIVPLKNADAIEGVLEIAFFRSLKPYEIELVQSMAENIASVLHGGKVNERVLALLKESQQKAEQLHAQEEEMRQSMEELVATQEELQRKEREVSTLVQGISTTLALIEFDLNGTILTANENFLNLMGYSLNEVVGKHHRMFVDSDYADSHQYCTFWNAIRGGQPQTGRFQRLTKDKENVWLHASYAPLKDSSGRILKVLKIASDVTKEYRLELETQERLEIMLCYEDEMKNTFEELQYKREQVDAYEEEMRLVFNDMEEYARKVLELEQKAFSGNQFVN